MLRARIAGRVVELIGCDTMAHAADFARFSFERESADFRMEVRVQDAIESPCGEHVDQYGDWREWRDGDGRIVLFHRSGQLLLSRDEELCEALLILRRDLPKADILHYLYVLQTFSYHLQRHGGCMLHSAGMRLGDAGIVLCGKSGVGKSTMARHLQALMPTASVLSEDMPALREENGWTLHGTPFCGDDTQCENASAPLRGIVLLRQAAQNRLVCPRAQEAMFELLSAVPRPVYSEQLTATLTDRLLRLSQQVPILLFENDGTRDAAAMLLARMHEDGWIHPSVC